MERECLEKVGFVTLPTSREDCVFLEMAGLHASWIKTQSQIDALTDNGDGVSQASTPTVGNCPFNRHEKAFTNCPISRAGGVIILPFDRMSGRRQSTRQPGNNGSAPALFE